MQGTFEPAKRRREATLDAVANVPWRGAMQPALDNRTSKDTSQHAAMERSYDALHLYPTVP